MLNIKKAQKAKHPLKAAVCRQVGGASVLYDIASDVAKYGASGGYSGFIYYSDTVAFAKRHKAKIISQIKETAAHCGVSFVEFICGFNGLKGYDQDEILAAIYDSKSDDGTKTQVFNVLAWYALEDVCYTIVNTCEDE